ncbi:MAG: YceD family protein [Bacilli bacterium]|nr:YceD family protein [Bacilli bacterium]
MNIDIIRLINNFTENIEIDEQMNFDSTYISNTDIRKLDNIKVKGNITKSSSHIYHLILNVSGIMVLPCSITLEDVEYPFSINISEILSDLDDIDENYLKINSNIIDISSIIWQNIILEVPIRVVKENKYNATRGEGWKLIEEENID